MAKVIKYNICARFNLGTKEAPIWIDTFYPTEIGWNEANEETAKREAHNGEYTIEDDGRPALMQSPTQLDVIEAQVTYTAMMTDTLLEV